MTREVNRKFPFIFTICHVQVHTKKKEEGVHMQNEQILKLGKERRPQLNRGVKD